MNMYSQSAIKKLKNIYDRVNYILEICENYGGVEKALEDSKIAQPAIMIHILVCKENLRKLQNEINVLDFFSNDELRWLNIARNMVLLNYDNLNLAMIEKIIRESLPNIKERLSDFFDEMDKTK